MHSIQIRTMLTGYANHAAELGHQKKGAVPLSAAEMEMLLRSLHDKHHSMTGSTESLLLLKDGLLLSLLWQTCFRDVKAGSLRLLPTGGSPLPSLSPSQTARKREQATPAARQHKKTRKVVTAVSP